MLAAAVASVGWGLAGLTASVRPDVAGAIGVALLGVFLTTRGRKSGREYTTPMVYTRDGDRLLVYASQGGSPDHPDWYLNLVANPGVIVDVGSERYDAVATPLKGEDRDREYAAQAKRSPQFAEYQEKTDRVIPVVAVMRR